jgi:hypothetical protein
MFTTYTVHRRDRPAAPVTEMLRSAERPNRLFRRPMLVESSPHSPAGHDAPVIAMPARPAERQLVLRLVSPDRRRAFVARQ